MQTKQLPKVKKSKISILIKKTNLKNICMNLFALEP
jgi:hypothetical protein